MTVARAWTVKIFWMRTNNRVDLAGSPVVVSVRVDGRELQVKPYGAIVLMPSSHLRFSSIGEMIKLMKVSPLILNGTGGSQFVSHQQSGERDETKMEQRIPMKRSV